MNVYDIRKDQELYYIFDSDGDYNNIENTSIDKKKIVIILFLFYEDMLERWYGYLDVIPSYIKCIVISSNERIAKKIKENEKYSHITIIVSKENGRDISALLVTAKEYVVSADYVCYVHDKKEHQNLNRVSETDFWVLNMWENTMASEMYIEKIISKFEECRDLGILCVPEPIGMNYDTWAGQGWYGSYDATRKLANKLDLQCDLTPDAPPISIGTVLWFRVEALKKLFNYGWSYSDFDDKQLSSSDYLSYAIERIFPYVAQDAGFKTGTVMTSDFAEKIIARAQAISNIYTRTLKELLGITTAADCVLVLNTISKLRTFLVVYKIAHIYGAGRWGRICHKLLNMVGIETKCFLTTDKSAVIDVEGVPVYCFNDIKINKNELLLVSVSPQAGGCDVLKMLDEKHVNYYWIWE